MLAVADTDPNRFVAVQVTLVTGSFTDSILIALAI